MSWCGNRKGSDARRFSAKLRELGQKYKFAVKSEFFCMLKDCRLNRLQFDHAVMYKGKLRLLEFDDKDYAGRNHPHRAEKIYACGISNVPFLIFYSRDFWSEDVDDHILSFVFTNVTGIQDVTPSKDSSDFVLCNLSWQMERQYDNGKCVFGWQRRYIGIDINGIPKKNGR